MRRTCFLLVVSALVVVLTAGCATVNDEMRQQSQRTHAVLLLPRSITNTLQLKA